MSDLDHEIWLGLERLTRPGSGAEHPTVETLAERRRRRRVRRATVSGAAAAAALVLVVAAGVIGTAVLGSGGDDPANVAIGDGGGGSGPATTPSQPDVTQPGAPTTPNGSDIEPESHTLDENEADAARDVVTDFLDDLRADDLEAAAERWTGYPELGPEASVDERIPFIEDLLARPDFSRIVHQGDTEVFVNPSWGWTGAEPVVTVLVPAPAEEGGLPVVSAFAMDAPAPDGDEPMQIRYLPGAEFPGSGGGIAYSGVRGEVEVTGLVPVEGGARAFVGTDEVPVAVDHDARSVTITLPEGLEAGDVAVTLSIAGPEGSGAGAFVLVVPET